MYLISFTLGQLVRPETIPIFFRSVTFSKNVIVDLPTNLKKSKYFSTIIPKRLVETQCLVGNNFGSDCMDRFISIRHIPIIHNKIY